MYARGSNPRIDRPILRKSLHYAVEQVENLLAEWADPVDPSQGIIAREFLPSSKRFETIPIESVNWAEIPGIKFARPKMEKNPTIARLMSDPLALRLLRKEKQMSQRRRELQQVSA